MIRCAFSSNDKEDDDEWSCEVAAAGRLLLSLSLWVPLCIAPVSTSRWVVMVVVELLGERWWLLSLPSSAMVGIAAFVVVC